MSQNTKPVVGNVLARFTKGLRFPQLFFITLVLFLIDLFVPDMIPLFDEIFLGLVTLLIGSFKRRRK